MGASRKFRKTVNTTDASVTPVYSVTLPTGGGLTIKLWAMASSADGTLSVYYEQSFTFNSAASDRSMTHPTNPAGTRVPADGGSGQSFAPAGFTVTTAAGNAILNWTGIASTVMSMQIEGLVLKTGAEAY